MLIIQMVYFIFHVMHFNVVDIYKKIAKTKNISRKQRKPQKIFYDSNLLIGDFKFPDNVKRILFLFKRVNRETTALY